MAREIQQESTAQHRAGYKKFSDISERAGKPPSLGSQSGVVMMNDNVVKNMNTAPMLPAADAAGNHRRTAINVAIVTSMAPMIIVK